MSHPITTELVEKIAAARVNAHAAHFNSLPDLYQLLDHLAVAQPEPNPDALTAYLPAKEKVRRHQSRRLWR